MRPIVLALAALLLTAGCLGGTGENPDENADTERRASTNLTGEAAENFPEASENATYLQNQDYSDEHIHDYWNGADERILMDEVVETQLVRDVFLTAFWPFIAGEPRASVGNVWFTLPNGSFVPEGTGELFVEIDATAALKGGQVALAYRPANGDDFVFLDPQAAQASWTIELTPEMADLPHSSSTRWYWLVSAEGPGAVLDGPINVRVTAKRLFDIEAWPEHPDFWQQGHLTRLDLANLSGTYDYAEAREFMAEESGLVKVHLPPGVIVPPETKVLLVDFQYTRSGDAKNTLNGEVELAVKEGSTAGYYRGMWWETIEREDGHKVYAIQVDESNQDSPYAAESGWAFEVHAFLGAEAPTGDGRWNMGIAEVGSGEFTLDVKAFRVLPDWLEQAIEEDDR